MAYIGNAPGSIRQGRRAVYEFTSTANQTAFSGVDDNGLTLDLLQANDNDVYLNGVRLIITDDYTISGDILTLVSGAAAGDKLIVMTQDEIANDASYSKAASDSRYINYDGDVVNGTIQMGGGPGNNITFADNNKAIFGSELEIYSDATHARIREYGSGQLKIQGDNMQLLTSNGASTYLEGNASTSAVTLYHASNSPRLSTTATGIDVTGNVVVSGTVDGRDIATDGTKLDTVEASADVTDATNVAAALLSGVTTKELDLAAIAKDISDTAVDVFIYDTRKDSDGGAWRKRTQHTSWYNETLNTATRGSRKEFPAVAVIVIESLKLTVYDGDDPDLPMWMVINADASTGGGVSASSSGITTTKALFHVSTLNATAGLNGQMIVGTGNWHVFNFNFVDDKISFHAQYGTFGAGQAIYSNPISGRNSSGRFVRVTSVGILTNAVYDVAMTVLPNAPIDAATGLPVPTIAVATLGGISYIHNDGTVIDNSVNNTANYRIRSIDFDGYDRLIMNFASNSTDKFGTVMVLPVPYADTLASYEYAFYNFGFYGWGLSATNLPISDSNNYNVTDTEVVAEKSYKFGANIGLQHVEHVDTSLKAGIPSSVITSGMFAQTSSDYATGYQVGDIKLATLSDTDDTDLVGGDYADFSLSGTHNNGGQSSISLSGSDIVITYVSGAPGWGGFVFDNLTVGSIYVLEFEATGSRGYQRVGTTTNNGTNFTGNTITFTASASTMYLNFGMTSSQGPVVVSSVSVRLAESDRSVNNKGLQVFGTVTKNPVATGADLVAYSGFSSSNYLLQPYNSDLQFGTGDFAFNFWVNCSSINSQSIFSTVAAGTGSGIEGVACNTGSTGVIGFAVYTQGIQVTGRTNCGFTDNLTANKWVMLSCIRRSGTLELWVDGKLNATIANTADLSDTDSTLRVGGHNNGGAANNCKLALFRASATAPSSEQIKKIYEDEKFLFQENAKATLYGSSDAVTALAYDDDTELLHVGTSSGRSVFQGLRRIDNTTDAVGAAISASNGMVAED